jgi:hypothetical protein
MSIVNFTDAQLKKTNAKIAFAFAASILLSACGAGGGSETAAVESSNLDNQAPQVEEQVPVQVAPVQIFSHPQSVTVEAGQNASFSVAASGGGSLGYQWLKNGQMIQGATTNTLMLVNSSESDAAVYSGVVSNSAGSQTSLSALLTVNAAPVVIIEQPVVEEPIVEEPIVEEPIVEEPIVAPVAILSQPQSVTVDENNSASFSVQVSGDGQISYQWLKDGAVINGATSSSLSISAATLADAAEYSVVVTNSEGPVFSDAASLTVNAVQPIAKSIALSWDVPQEREDGSALETYEIDGYVIAYGTDANNLDQQITVEGGLVLEAVVENLTQGTYYFAIATVDSDGMQGAYSATIEQSI